MRARIHKLQKKFDARGLDAFVVMHEANVRYLAGTGAAEALVVSKNSILLCNRLEFDRVKRESWIEDVRAYSKYRLPLRAGEEVKFGELWQLVSGCLRELGAGTIGFDVARSSFLQKLKAFHRANYRELPGLVTELRLTKSGQELRFLRKTAKLASKGMRRAAELIEVGRREFEVAAEAEYTMRKAGSEGVAFPTIVGSGKNSCLPHATSTEKRLRKGELIVVDLGASYRGYVSDMSRTFALKPSGKQKRLIELVKRAQAKGIEKVKAGVLASAVDGAARRILSGAGYASFCPHSLGHGVGLEVHEPPTLSPESKEFLQKNSVVTAEPGIYIPRVGGVRLEDMVLVKSKGREILTTFD